jgi:hypothetical protein
MMDKSTLLPLKKFLTNTEFLHLVFYVSIDITIWIIFVCLKYIGLDLDLKQSLKKKNPTNIGELQYMKYICDKIILDTKCEKLHIYFKTRVVGGIFWFVVNTIDIHQLNLGPFGI